MIWWDLRYELSKEPRLRTSPLHAPWVKVGPQGWRPLSGRGGRMSILAPPGNYTVKLSVGEKEFRQKLIVKKDPHSEGSEEDIQAQLKLLLEIQNNLNAVVDMINQLEWIRKQISDLESLVMGDKDAESIRAAGKTLDHKVIAVEDNLYQLRVTGRGQDYWAFRGKSRLVSKLLSLARSVGSADFPPTSQEKERHKELSTQLETYKSQFKELVNNDLPVFNRLLKEQDLPHVLIVKIP